METRPIYEIPGLKNNDPAQLDAFQTMLLPYIDLIQALWWMLFFGTAAYLLTRFILVPLWRRHCK